MVLLRKAVVLVSSWCSKVLVAYDGSTPSKHALELACSIGSQDTTVEFLFVHVVKLYGLGTGAESAIFDEANRVLCDLQELASTLPNPANTKLLKGTSPADLILKCARDENCDLIIMGNRGQGGVKGYLGSVSYSVVQASPIAVLIAKDGLERATGDKGKAASNPTATQSTQVRNDASSEA